MPFLSESQRRYLWKMKPDIAREFAKKTPRGIKLPKKLDNPRTIEQLRIKRQAKYGR